MKKHSVYVAGDNVITSLGFTTDETVRKIKNNIIGFKVCDDRSITPSPIPLSLVDSYHLDELFQHTVEIFRPVNRNVRYTRAEKLFILSIYDATKELPVEIFETKTHLIISTTKGNIDLLEEEKKTLYETERIKL